MTNTYIFCYCSIQLFLFIGFLKTDGLTLQDNLDLRLFLVAQADVSFIPGWTRETEGLTWCSVAFANRKDPNASNSFTFDNVTKGCSLAVTNFPVDEDLENGVQVWAIRKINGERKK